MKYQQPYGVSDPNAGYINGNPSTGTMGSIPPAASIEYPQREIVNLIGDARAVPSDADLHQLAKAVQSGQLIYADDAGTVNALSVILSPNVAATFIKGLVIVCKAATTNTGPSTLSVNGAGIWPIVHATDGTPLNSYDINAGSMQAFAFDGTRFQQVWSQRQPGAPVYLTGPRDYYVNGATGNDAWDGQSAAFSTGIHGPFATMQQACNQIPLFNLNGWSITIHVADYTYTWFAVPKLNGSGQIFFVGNHAVPGNCVINGINRSSVFMNDVGGQIYMDGFKVQCAGSQAGDAICGINVFGATTCILDAFEFGPCVGAHITTQRGGLVSNRFPASPWKISGGCTGNAYLPGCFVFAYVQGNFVENSGGGPAITISAPISFAGSFVQAVNSSFAEMIYSSLTGAANVTGKRYDVSYNSSIVTGSGANPNYYPGTIAGTQATGGYYT